jgi:SPP1 gp7 family putative phage head morphogenesis protein
VSRLLARYPTILVYPQRLFNDSELEQLAEVFARVGSTADLLGRGLVRDWQRRKEEQNAVAESLLHEALTVPLTPLTPEAALDYFMSLVPTIGVDPQHFGPAMRRRAFTMAVATDTNLLDTVQTIITDVIASGEKVSAAPKMIQQVLDRAGVAPRNPQYAEMIARTNAMDAYNVGAFEEMTAPDVVDTFPVWKYSAIVDERSRPWHAARDGLYYPSSVPFTVVRGTTPRDVANCRCVLPGNFIRGKVCFASKAIYAGEAFKIITASGVTFSITKNHPVFTENGLLPACHLHQGLNLWSYRMDVQLPINADVQEAPTLIEQVFNSLASWGILKTVSGLDFQGDGKFIKGKVQIVGTDRQGRTKADSQTSQQVTNVSLEFANAGGMGRSHLEQPLRRCHARPFQRFGLTAVARSNTQIQEFATDTGSCNPEMLSDGFFRKPLLDVQTPQFVSRNDAPLARSKAMPSAPLLEMATDGSGSYAEFIGDLLHRHPGGSMFLDQIRSVKRFHYQGPVYDLQTDTGYFLTGWNECAMVFLKNCTFIPIDKWDWHELQARGVRLAA